LRLPKVRKYFDIPEKLNRPPPDLGLKKQGFIKGAKSGMLIIYSV